MVVGTLLNSLLRHGDRVKIANQAQLVNLLGLIRTEEADRPGVNRSSSRSPRWRTPPRVRSSERRSLRPSSHLQYGDVDVVDVAPRGRRDDGSVSIFVANRSLEETAEVPRCSAGLRAQVRSARVLTIPEGADRFAANTAESQPVGLTELIERRSTTET